MINSDNAKTFKFANKFLDSLARDRSVLSFLQARRINWKFNLERSPWWGGYFERMVGTVKRCLKKTLGNARMAYGELLTVLIEVETTLNARPLTYIYDEVGYEPLTPFHLMHGRRLNQLADEVDFKVDDLEDSTAYTRRFRYLIKKLDHFWSRWRHEYLIDLREIHRNSAEKEIEIGVGDVVLIKEDNVKRSQWKMGRVEDLIKGRDGIVRGAKVRTMTRGKPQFMNRPLQKLFPFEVNGRDVQECEGNENEKDERSVRCEEGMAPKENGELVRAKSQRAAAKDSQWKTRSMLDSV